MSYKPRLTAPESGNKYYLKAPTGYSPCILGNDKYGIRPSPHSVLPNCVGYAVGRFNEIIGKKSCKYLGSTNAELFIKMYASAQGLEVGQTPKLGAVMVWKAGGTMDGKDGAGHVAIVEKVNSATSVVTSESGWTSRKIFWTQNRTKGTGRWGQSSNYAFLGFIYNPAVVFELCPYKEPAKAIKRGARGEAVRWMQWHLNWHGYNLAVDGRFGPASDKALRDFQKQHGLVVDGSCGPATRAKLIATLPWNS